MYSIRKPSPAEVEAGIRVARAERSRVICGFFRRLIVGFSHRQLGRVGTPKTA